MQQRPHLRMQRVTSSVLGLVLGLATIPANATVVKALSLYEKTQSATLIARARVESVESSWDIEGHTAKTLIRLKAIEVVKGDLPASGEFVVRQVGGRIGDFVHEVPGTSSFEKGEEAILFLEPGLGGAFVEIGVGIGKYGVTELSGEQVVTHNPSVALAYIEPGRPMRIEEAGAMTPEKLPKFMQRVRNYVTGVQKPRYERGNPPELRLKFFRPAIERELKASSGRSE